MLRIFKYPIPRIADTVRLTMPEHARVLTVTGQYGQLVLCALVQPSARDVTRLIHIVGTGNPADHIATLPWLGTIVDYPPGLGTVWHFFDGGEVHG